MRKKDLFEVSNHEVEEDKEEDKAEEEDTAEEEDEAEAADYVREKHKAIK